MPTTTRSQLKRSKNLWPLS